MKIAEDKLNLAVADAVADSVDDSVVAEVSNGKGRNKKNRSVAVLLLMLICGISACCYTMYFDYARSPFAIEYEGHVLWACATLAQGKNVYDAASLVQQPFGVIMYNPLFLVIGAALVKIFGVQLMPLRVISMASVLLMLPGFFLVLKRSRLSDFHAVMGMALLASCMPILYWSNVARVDMLGLMLSIWGLERFMAGWKGRNVEKNSINSLLLSSVLFTLAFFTKQQYFVFPAAATIFCVLEGSPRLGLKHLVSWLLPILAIGVTLEVVTGGGYLAHLRYAQSLPWEAGTLGFFIGQATRDPKMIGGFIIIAAGLFAAGRRRPFDRLALILLSISLPLAMYTMGLRAAFHNHLLCVDVALFWLVAVTLPRLSPKFTITMLVLALVGSYVAFGECFYFIADRLILFRETRTAMASLAKQNLRGKMILSEDPTIALTLGATTDLVDSTTIFNICRAKPDGLRPFIDNIKRLQYPVIILNSADVVMKTERIWPKPLVEAILKNYKLAGYMGGNGNPQRVYFLKSNRSFIQ